MKNFVKAKAITPEEYKEITGDLYDDDDEN